MTEDMDSLRRREVVDAYAAITRLRVYVRLSLVAVALFFVADLGGMVVGWLPIDVGVLGLINAALLATVTAAHYTNGAHRTTLYAMDLERTLPGGGRLDESSLGGQALKAVTSVVVIAGVMTGAGILGYSLTNAGTQTPVGSVSQAVDRDDDDESDGGAESDTDDAGTDDGNSDTDDAGDSDDGDSDD
ncbi:MAG: hypothetical protein OEU98_00880 [Actinomycetota bacterium]|nr:hypothetical protein [Actinomycetota bacterium]